jgi:hypothetical protein
MTRHHSEPTWEGFTAEYLASHNTPALLAHQLVHERQQRDQDATRHRDELHALRGQLQEAHRIGLRVLSLHVKGRRSVRITDLIEEQS